MPQTTHTHPFNGPLSGTTWVSQYQKGKTNLDFTEARDSEWQWHQLGHMQVCTVLQTDNHASTPPLSFLQAGCPSCRPTNSVKALKAQTTPVPQTTPGDLSPLFTVAFLHAKPLYRTQPLQLWRTWGPNLHGRMVTSTTFVTGYDFFTATVGSLQLFPRPLNWILKKDIQHSLACTSMHALQVLKVLIDDEVAKSA